MGNNTKQTPFYDPPGMTTVPNHISFTEPTNLCDHIWVLDGVIDEDWCEKIVSFFENNKESQVDGVTGAGMNKEVKDSKDLMIRNQNESFLEVDSVLYQKLHEGTGRVVQELHSHPCSVGWSPDEVFHHDIGYQLQKTSPGGRYVWHIENSQSQHCFAGGSAFRTLTYIIYLNDVPEEDGGSTGFLYQKIKVQPKAGRMVLFPPYWTHVHSGYPLLAGTKYIATGWFFSEAHKV